MATVRTINRLINAVLCEILNVYHPGESIDAADAETIFHITQDRLAAWSDNITVPISITEYFAMVVGTASYTIGEDGAPTGKDTVRPEKIIGAYVKVGSYDHPVEIITEEQYRNIRDKTSTGRPTKCYPNYTTPNITVYFYPVPDSTDNFYFVSIKPMTEPTAYTTDTFNTLGIPGYIYDALKWRVAIDAAPAFSKPISAEVKFNADDAFNRMQAKHLARTMTGGVVEMAMRRGRGSYSLADFFAGE